jgi:hypothetical protein
MSSTAAPFDQAAGLRELFAGFSQASEPATAAPAWVRAPAVHALVCPQRPAMALPMAQACTQWWRQQSVPHLWVDELDFEHREDWPLPFKLRYDLAQGLAGHVPLKQTLHTLSQSQAPMYYASARRLAHYASEIIAPLVRQLQRTPGVLDHLILSLDPRALARPLSVYGAPVRPLLLCEASQDAVQGCLQWLNEQPIDGGLDLNAVSVVFYSEQPDSATSAQAQAHWQDSWLALRGSSPAWVGHAPIAPTSGLSSHLPDWQRLAVQWLTHLSRA